MQENARRDSRWLVRSHGALGCEWEQISGHGTLLLPLRILRLILCCFLWAQYYYRNACSYHFQPRLLALANRHLVSGLKRFCVLPFVW